MLLGIKYGKDVDAGCRKCVPLVQVQAAPSPRFDPNRGVRAQEGAMMSRSISTPAFVKPLEANTAVLSYSCKRSCANTSHPSHRLRSRPSPKASAYIHLNRAAGDDVPYSSSPSTPLSVPPLLPPAAPTPLALPFPNFSLIPDLGGCGVPVLEMGRVETPSDPSPSKSANSGCADVSSRNFCSKACWRGVSDHLIRQK